MLYAAHKGVFELAATEEREVPVVTCDFATAELVKVAANYFLATKISFINAMAEICEAVGADVTLLAKAIGYDPRIGQRYLQAGVGFGGGCLPKDIRAFRPGRRLGAGEALRFLHEVDLINTRRGPGAQARRGATRPAVRPSRPTCPESASRCSAPPSNNTDDVRDAPSLAVASCCTRRAPTSTSTTRRAWTTPAPPCHR